MSTFVANRMKPGSGTTNENEGAARTRVNKALFARTRVGQPK